MPETRNKTIETINTRQIQKIMLEAVVNLDSSRIGDYLKHRPLSPERVQKLENAVEQIVYVGGYVRAVPKQPRQPRIA
jgi:hypothetical protein